eukprot:COSAG01_NODE_14303_length_1471_cov_2.446064_1_plen_49_part_10
MCSSAHSLHLHAPTVHGMDGDTIAALTEALSVGCAGRSGDSDGSVSLVG